jgi:decaprenyl-phosphate phosphoribosyltransferase
MPAYGRLGSMSSLPETAALSGPLVARARAGRARGPVRAAIVTMRPRQWIKNALVVAAAGAAGALGHDDVPVRVGLACIAFCLLASGIYAINDVRDAPEDRGHPRKRDRPVAAGELGASTATILGVGLIAAGLGLCAAVRPLLGLVGGAYVALTVSYTVLWRHVIALDIAAVAGGFVLRAVAGGVAAPVALSRWFVLVVTAAAVMVAAGKRYAELRRTEASGHGRRRVLTTYSRRQLEVALTGAAIIALFAYGVWAFGISPVHGIPWRPITALPFAVCTLRYLQLVRSGGGEAPEDLMLADRWLLFGGVAWLVVFGLSVHAAG